MTPIAGSDHSILSTEYVLLSYRRRGRTRAGCLTRRVPRSPRADPDPFPTQHSRLLDGSPIYPPSSSAPTSQSTTTDGRRLSRLPPGVALVDPFGFNVSNEPSPYDLAYAHSAAAQTSGITAASSPRSAARASFLGAYSAMGSGGAPPGVTASPGPSPTISPSPSTSSVTQFAAPPQQGEYGAPAQPWVKQRAASAGEPGQTARAQVRNGLLAPGAGLRHSTTGRSKLSGEIDADVRFFPLSWKSESENETQS